MLCQRPSPPPEGPEPAHNLTRNIAGKAEHAEEALMRALRLQSRALFRTGALLVVSVGGLLYAFGDDVLTFFGKQTADVATRGLEQQELQLKANQVAKAVVNEVLTDPAVMQRATEFVQSLARQPGTQQELVRLTVSVLQDPATLAQVQQLATRLVSDLLRDPALMRQFQDLVLHVLGTTETQAAVMRLVQAVMANEDARRAASEFAVAVTSDDKVLVQLHALAAVVSTSVLADESVLGKAKVLVKEVVEDDAVQRSTGQLLWGAAAYSVKPRWLP